MALLDTLKNLIPGNSIEVVKNPNYNPNDPNSKRYVDANTGNQEAENRASLVNDLFRTAGNLRNPVTASMFAANPALGLLSAGASQLFNNDRTQTANNRIATNPLPQNNPLTAGTQAAQPSAGVGGTPTLPSTTTAPSSDLATLAAQAGLSVADYQKILEGQSIASEQDVNNIRTNLGIDQVAADAFAKPSTTRVEMYKELYDLSGLRDLKDKIAEVDERLNSRRDDLVKAAGEIKNNPWLSQGSRTGRLRILNELATADISNILDERQQYLDLYDQGITEIEKQIGFFGDDQADARTLSADQLNYLLGEAERQQTALERSTLAEGLRNIPSFLRAQVAEQQRQEQVAYNLKYGSGADAVAGMANSALVDQPAYSQLTATQKTRADSLNNLVRSMTELKTYYEENPGIFGGRFGNVVGEDAGVLATKVNGVIFAAAQAEGTGALQEADRAVIEQMIPNPTNLGGVASSFFRGGKEGNVNRIQDQINKYSQNLRNLGLEPATAGASSAGNATQADVDYVSTLNLPAQ